MLLIDVDRLVELWQRAMPDLQPPDAFRLQSWSDMYPNEIVEYAIARTGEKARAMQKSCRQFSPFDATRYCGATMRHEAERREHRDSRPRGKGADASAS